MRGFLFSIMSEDKKKFEYATVNFAKKKALKITAQQYLYLDCIRVMQANPKYQGWAYASNQYYAELFDMSVRGVQKITKTMTEKGLMIMGKGSLRKLSQKGYDILTYELDSPTNKVHLQGEQSSPQTRTKFTPSHEQSSPNSKRDKERDKESDNNEIHPSVLANRKKVQEEIERAKEQVHFASIDLFKDFVSSSIDLSVIGRWREFNQQQRQDFLTDFAEYWVVGQEKTWDSPKDLKSHMINALKRYRPKAVTVNQQAQNNFYKKMKVV